VHRFVSSPLVIGFLSVGIIESRSLIFARTEGIERLGGLGGGEECLGSGPDCFGESRTRLVSGWSWSTALSAYRLYFATRKTTFSNLL
jgi:hypothetical protein